MGDATGPVRIFWDISEKYVRDDERQKRTNKFLGKCWTNARKVVLRGVAGVTEPPTDPTLRLELFVETWIADVIYRLYQAANGFEQIGMTKEDMIHMFIEMRRNCMPLEFLTEDARPPSEGMIRNIVIATWKELDEGESKTGKKKSGGGGKKEKDAGSRMETNWGSSGSKGSGWMEPAEYYKKYGGGPASTVQSQSWSGGWKHRDDDAANYWMEPAEYYKKYGGGGFGHRRSSSRSISSRRRGPARVRSTSQDRRWDDRGDLIRTRNREEKDRWHWTASRSRSIHRYPAQAAKSKGGPSSKRPFSQDSRSAAGGKYRDRRKRDEANGKVERERGYGYGYGALRSQDGHDGWRNNTSSPGARTRQQDRPELGSGSRTRSTRDELAEPNREPEAVGAPAPRPQRDESTMSKKSKSRSPVAKPSHTSPQNSNRQPSPPRREGEAASGGSDDDDDSELSDCKNEELRSKLAALYSKLSAK